MAQHTGRRLGASAFRGLLAGWACSVAGVGAALLAGCTGLGNATALALTGPGVPASLRDLAQRAQSGDKQAQLELGIAFEEGRGVPRDLRKARHLYAQAARDSGGPLWVYTPPVVPGQSGRVVRVEGARRVPGLELARHRLEGLRD